MVLNISETRYARITFFRLDQSCHDGTHQYSVWFKIIIVDNITDHYKKNIS